MRPRFKNQGFLPHRENATYPSSRVCISISVDHRARASFARNDYIVVGPPLLLLLLLL